MPRWRDLEHGAPEIARAGRRLLEDADGRPEAAFLATVSAHGTPRLHPFVPAIVDGALYAFITASLKRGDLDRTGAFALHSCLGPDDESFYVAGRARAVADESTREKVAGCMPYDDVDDNHRLFEFTVERALWTTWTTPTSPAYRRWPDA